MLDLIEASICKAEEASEKQSGSLIQRSSSGTGEKLRANFALLLETILQQDSRLLSIEELATIQSYKVRLRPCSQLPGLPSSVTC